MLPRLKSISSFFYIHSNSALLSIGSAFSALISIGEYLKIHSNAKLATTGVAFPQLTAVAEDVIISYNNVLVSVDGLCNALIAVGGSLAIQPNNLLETWDGAFNALESIGDVNIFNDAEMTRMSPVLDAVTTIVGSLTITGLTVTSFDDFFPKLKVIGKFLKIFSNNALLLLGNETSAFPALESVGEHLTIEQNAKLANTSIAFPQLTTVTEAVVIRYNYALVSVDGVCAALTSVGGLTFQGNNLLKTLDGAFVSLESTGDITIRSDADVTFMSPVLNIITTIVGSLTITGLVMLTSLDQFLPKLMNVTGFLYIYSNDGLVVLGNETSAFPALVSVGGDLLIQQNANLATTGVAFPRLTAVAEVSINNTDALVSVDGLCTTLRSAGSLTIQGNYLLEMLDGAFIVLERTTDSIDISSNSALRQLSTTFAALTKVDGYVNVASNPALQAMSGAFGKVLAVGQYVRIYDNDALSSLNDMFSSLVTAGEGITIQSNDNSACTSMDNSFPVLTTATQVIISSNSFLQTVKTSFNSLVELGAGLTIANNGNLLDVPDFQNDVTFKGTTVAVYSNAKLTSLDGLDKLLCVHSDGCILSWYTNAQLTREDVCDVWTALSRAGSTGGPQQEYSSKSSGSYRPSYGPYTRSYLRDGTSALCT
jgi:hypothetical protein